MPISRGNIGSIKILAPADNAILDAGEEYPLNYEIALGSGDGHFHVWVADYKSSAQRTGLKGTESFVAGAPYCAAFLTP